MQLNDNRYNQIKYSKGTYINDDAFQDSSEKNYNIKI